MSEFAALVNIDWADKKHAISLFDPATGELRPVNEIARQWWRTVRRSPVPGSLFESISQGDQSGLAESAARKGYPERRGIYYRAGGWDKPSRNHDAGIAGF